MIQSSQLRWHVTKKPNGYCHVRKAGGLQLFIKICPPPNKQMKFVKTPGPCYWTHFSNTFGLIAEADELKGRYVDQWCTCGWNLENRKLGSWPTVTYAISDYDQPKLPATIWLSENLVTAPVGTDLETAWTDSSSITVLKITIGGWKWSFAV